MRQPNRHNLRLGRIYWLRVLSAHGILTASDAVFDHVVYPLVLAWLGNIAGGVVMTLASMIICAAVLAFYEYGKVDWLGVDAVEAVKEHGESWVRRLDSAHWAIRTIAWLPSRVFLLVLWAIKKSDIWAFIALSLYEDAFKTTAFLRKGKFDRFGRKDAMIFLASLLISNVYWIIRWSVILEVLVRSFRFIMGIL